MIIVKVPATTANIGPGFDSLGIALNLYNEFYFEEIKDGKNVIFQGCLDEFANEDNMVYKAFKRVFEKLGRKIPSVSIGMKCDIPISRGLGSSAACILGGVLGANAIAGNIFSKEEVLQIATEIEGHPDNLAPALYGGLTVSLEKDKKIITQQIWISEDLGFSAVIPEYRLSTTESRGVLPKKIDYSDAVFNIGRSLMLISGFANDNKEAIAMACEDKLHQPYRSKLIKNYDEIEARSKSLGALGVFLSGAGPTVMTIFEKQDKRFFDNFKKDIEDIDINLDVKLLEVDRIGAFIK